MLQHHVSVTAISEREPIMQEKAECRGALGSLLVSKEQMLLGGQADRQEERLTGSTSLPQWG
jgi:hypothetical protein